MTRNMKEGLVFFQALALWAGLGGVAPAAASSERERVPSHDTWELDAGTLKLSIHISKTAHLFHVVDQISQWSQFCHRQYVSYFKGLDGGISGEDRELLAQHTAIRKAHGWGGGLESAFYTPLDLEPALAQAVNKAWLTEQEAAAEKRILIHFRGRVERLMADEIETLHRFREHLSSKRSELKMFAETLSRFVGSGELAVPVFLIANPDDSSIGGGYNGGRLTLEIPRQRDTYPSLLHELFHAFIRTRQDWLRSAASAVPGLDEETLSEGLAYAYSPGLVHDPVSDQLLKTVADYLERKTSMKDSYTRFNLYGLALRPLLRDALGNPNQTLQGLLPRATDVWLGLAELEKARDRDALGKAWDSQKDQGK